LSKFIDHDTKETKAGKLQILSYGARLESLFERRKCHTLPKSAFCVFGKNKKDKIKPCFGLKNRFLAMDLTGPFSKSAFCQRVGCYQTHPWSS
jgi:hypothetical protein